MDAACRNITLNGVCAVLVKGRSLEIGLCLGPVLGSRFGPKSGASHRKILLLPADVLQADLRPSSLNMNVNTYLFSLCVPRPLATVQETNWDAQREKACVNTYAHASASQICLQNICGQQQNFPMAGPTFGSKSGPQNRAQAKT